MQGVLMTAIALFWTGVGLVVVAIVGLAFGLCRAAASGDELAERALRQEREARDMLYQPSSSQHPSRDDEPRASTFLPGARGDNFNDGDAA
jgi:hypothetical protein